MSSRALVDACDALGMDTEALLGAAGLARADVTDPDARIPIDKMTMLWREAYARADDPDLALFSLRRTKSREHAVLARHGGCVMARK